MKIKVKLFFIFIMVLGITSIFNSNIFAATLSIEQLDEECKYICSSQQSNYVYSMDGNPVYNIVPNDVFLENEDAYFSEDVFFDSDIINQMCLIAGRIKDSQVAQAAIWKLAGFEVTAVNSGSMEDVDNAITEIIEYIDLRNNSKNYFGNQTITFTYDALRDEYVTNEFKLGYFEKIRVFSNIEHYFEEKNSDEFVVTDKTSVSNGTYRIVIPRTAVTETIEPSIILDYGNTTYNPIMYNSYETSSNFIGTKILGSLIGEVDVEPIIPVTLLFLKGDINKDNYINSTDAAIVLDLFKNGNITEENLAYGDMNGDNLLNSTDAAMILDIYKNS